MSTILSAPPTFPAELTSSAATVARGEDRCATVIAELQTARLAPAVFVPGIEHQAAAAIIAAGLPGVRYHRRILHRRLDEHLILHAGTRSGVRVMACWDDRAHRVRMQVAEAGPSGLWDRIIAHFTEWELTGRPIPATNAPGTAL